MTRATFLAPLEESIARGTTLAEEMLALYHGRWDGSIEPVFRDYAY
jgi:glutamate--cysteine ligase